MACNVTITSVLGTQSPGGVVVEVLGTSQDCDSVLVSIQCGNTTYSETVFTSLTGEWEYQVETHCMCGGLINVKAGCVGSGGQQVPGCMDSVMQALVCEDDNCCLSPNIDVSAGACNSQGQREVTFTITGNVDGPQCPPPYFLYLDYGDSSGPSIPITISTSGPFTATRTHVYSAAVSTTYSATLICDWPLGCPPITIPVQIDQCTLDCCPKVTGTDVDLGSCTPDCKREVTLTTHYDQHASPCLPATLEWAFYDNQNQLITNVNPTAMSTGLPSPHIDAGLLFDPAQAPITGRLVSIFPADCDIVAETIIDVTECHSPPTCPSITSLAHAIRGCVEHQGDCCRIVDITVDAVVSLGCGPQSGNPRIRVDFGDGDYAEHQFNSSGSHSVTFPHRYCTPGFYTVTLSTEFPPICPGQQSITIQVPKCQPEECPPPEPPPPCPCCIWWFLALLLYFLGAAFGWHNAEVDIPYVTSPLVITPTLWAALLLAALILIVALCYMKHCKVCVECRIAKCTFWSCVIILVLLILIQVIGWIFGAPPFALTPWINCLIALIVLAFAAFAIMTLEKCQTFFETGACD